MLTHEFFVALTSTLVTARVRRSPFFIAVGSGDASWDTALPEFDRHTTALVAEVGRKALARRDVVFIDPDGVESAEPTSLVRLHTSFDGSEGVATLRECGLFGINASEDPGAGTLLAYYTHSRIEKTPEMSLRRSMLVDLSPKNFAPGTRVTRYLGNSSSEEVHDLEHTTPNCQIKEIRFDHRVYLTSIEHATENGYDFCAFCFDRELSRR